MNIPVAAQNVQVGQRDNRLGGHRRTLNMNRPPLERETTAKTVLIQDYLKERRVIISIN